MTKYLSAVVCAVLLAHYASGAPAAIANGTSSSITSPTLSQNSASPSPTVPYASDDPNYPIFPVDSPPADPQPIRGSLGGTILGPQNIPIDQENPDLLAPPTTDNGEVLSAKWPFSLSHNRLQTGGWARQQNTAQLPKASNLAGVDMRLEPGAIRELHWHSTAEWAYVMKGETQITAVDQNGKNYLATVGPGDLWYFPPGIPHSLQATAEGNGTEFLLVFDSGDFDENDTFLLTDWLAHVPKEVLAKNFQTSQSAFNNIPGQELYIFPSDPPSSNATAPEDPQGQVPNPFTFKFSNVTPTQYSGGTIKIADSTTFKAATSIAAAEVTVEPGALRELHWHPTEDEWGFFLEGQGRITIFAAQSNAQTYDYQAGDISYIPASNGHYLENTGNTTLRFLEIFNSGIYQDVSLSQWLALIPPALVKAHLDLPDSLIDNLNKSKLGVVGPKSTA
ncbi:oxalate decarboxylase [Irpex rosettiformis]|uniref:Oxalate decarboxylase n=1 Tax=Irpex rosettiformis TaxID=378272 RepID=A0ACB8UAE8_9APHY|nr:oxalate decarboxylase [Irpex rosettiformis]